MRGVDRRVLLTAGAAWAAAAAVAGPPSAAARAASRLPVIDRSADVSGGPVGASGAGDGVVVEAESWLDARTVDLLIRSPAVAARVPVRLLLPDGWSPRSGRRWPVVYLLHGGRDDYTSWTRETDIAALSAAYGVIVAMPEGGRAGFYSDWWNAGRGGPPRWETFHLSELIRILQGGYGASSARVLAGASSGGQGALVYGARNPGVFRFVASYSGLASNRGPGVPELIMGLLASEGFDPTALWGLPFLQRRVWQAYDATALVGALRGTEVYVSCGRVGAPVPSTPVDWSDGALIEAFTAGTVPGFMAAARRHGVPVTTHYYPGGTHSWPYWEPELHASWPSMMRALGVAGDR